MVNQFFCDSKYGKRGPGNSQVESLHFENKCENDEMKLCSWCVHHIIRSYLGHCHPFIRKTKQDENDKKIQKIWSHIICCEQNNKDFHYLEDCNECREKIRELVDDNINIIEQYLSADDDDEVREEEKDNFNIIYDVLNIKRMCCVKSARSCVNELL